MDYQAENAAAVDRWCRRGWIWGQPISHQVYQQALRGEWEVLLTPTKPVPHRWFGPLRGKRVLGLASGGGQQMPVFAALGAECTLLDYSSCQCESERLVARREGYEIEVIQADMTKGLPFPDGSFDLIFHPVSNCYVREVRPIFRECSRVLKRGGLLLGGYDTGLNYVFDEAEERIAYALPFDPLQDEAAREALQREDGGFQFSHTLEEQLVGQLEAGFRLTDLYEDTRGEGNLHRHNIPTFIATRCVRE